jgi:hypothetical protein
MTAIKVRTGNLQTKAWSLNSPMRATQNDFMFVAGSTALAKLVSQPFHVLELENTTGVYTEGCD